MKKILLLGAVLTLGLGATAQNRQMPKNARPVDMKAKQQRTQVGVETGLVAGLPLPQTPVRNLQTRGTSAISVVPIGTSSNAYGQFVATENQVSYNKELNAIVHCRRGNPAAGDGGASGKIQYSYSTDGGNTWDIDGNILTTTLPATTTGCRYPNIAIFNPSGNTDIANAKVFANGPGLSVATGSWGVEFNASSNLVYDVASVRESYVESPVAENPYWKPSGLKQTGGHLWSAILAANLDLGNYTKLEIEKYTPNAAGGFDRAATMVDFPLTQDSAVSQWRVAFNQDGSVGYFVVVGIDTDQEALTAAGKGSPRPVVWKTTDGGANWVKQPALDYETLPNLIAETYPFRYNNPDNIAVPYMSTIDMVVDNGGNLHIMAEMLSRFSAGRDSLGFIYSGTGTTSFGHFIYSASGSWDYNLIDWYENQDVAFGAIEITSKIQAGLATGGGRPFASYCMTDTLAAGTATPHNNSAPDMWVYGYDVSTNKYLLKNLTAGSDAEFGYIFGKIAEEVDNTNDVFTFHAVYTTPGASDVVACTHNYLQGATAALTEFTNDAMFSVSTKNVPNIASKFTLAPNPTNGMLRVNLSELTNAQVTVTNLLGAVVSTVKGQNNAINIDLSNQASGVYFITVDAKEGRGTQKAVLVK